MTMRSILAVVVSFAVVARALGEEPGPTTLSDFFHPPARFANDLGGYRSPLRFRDGRPVRTADEWNRRRREIQQTWHELMGRWPPLVEKPADRVPRAGTAR